MRKNYRDEIPNWDENSSKDGANYWNGSWNGNRKEFKSVNAQKKCNSDLSHAFSDAIEMLELSQAERANPNGDIFFCFQIIGLSLVFIMLGTLLPFFGDSSSSSPYPIVGVTFGLIGSSVMIGCLFILDDTVIHADLRFVNLSAVLMMIAHYGLLFEYLLDSPAAEYFCILLRTITFVIFFGSLISCFTRIEFLFPSPAKQVCARAPAFVACYACIIQSVSIMMHYGVLDSYFGSELISILSGILGITAGIVMVLLFFQVSHQMQIGFRPFHAIGRFFHPLIRKKQARVSRGSRDE